MHAAAYFASPIQGMPKARMPARSIQGSAALSDAVKEPAPDRMHHRMLKLAAVAGLHLALFAWLAQVDADKRDSAVPVRLEVRTIAVSMAPSEAPASSVREIAPRAKPLQQAVAKRAVPHLKKPQQRPAIVRTERLLAPRAEQAAGVAHAVPHASAPGRVEESSVHASAQTSSGTSPAPAGGSVSAARFDADYLRNPAPAYPALSRRQREEGKVQLDVTVSAEGRAAEVSVRQSSGYARLDQAALETVRQWRFVPARRGTEAVVAQVIVPIEFRLAN